jgi:hypothetical protein
VDKCFKTRKTVQDSPRKSNVWGDRAESYESVG